MDKQYQRCTSVNGAILIFKVLGLAHGQSQFLDRWVTKFSAWRSTRAQELRYNEIHFLLLTTVTGLPLIIIIIFN